MAETMRRRMHWWNGRQAGFSMIETLFVLIILGVVVASAMPVMERGVARSKADRAVATLANDLRGAFSLAARQHKPVRILVSTSNRTITIQDRATGTVYQKRELSQQNSAWGLTALSSSRAYVDIFPNGIASDTLNLRLGVSSNVRVLRMTRVGQIRTQ